MTAVRRVLVAVGITVIGYAVLSAITDPDIRLLGVLIFLAAVLVLHDAILLPLTIGIGVLLGRLPAPIRAPVRVARTTGILLAISCRTGASGPGTCPTPIPATTSPSSLSLIPCNSSP